MAPPRRQRRPVRLQERQLADGEEFVVYRIVPTDDRDDPAFVDAFRSHRELGLPPRRHSPEATTPRIHEGISVFESKQIASEVELALRARGNTLGDFVAEVRLVSGQGFTLARWGSRGHLTIFGDAVTLSQAVTDTLPIEEVNP